MNKRNFVFIVNPVSGTGKQKGIERLVQDAAVRHGARARVMFTEYAGHAVEIAREQARLGIDVVAVVGGDGSVNEVGRALMHTPSAMGIVPTGSGNGLARHLRIPLQVAKAVDHVFTGTAAVMDVGRIENHVFLSTAGFGFDAQVAHVFSKQKKRGFRTYVKTVRKELFGYRPFVFTVRNENDHITDQAFMLSVANIPQFGNNFTINPLATENDGLLNATVIRPFPRYRIPAMMARFFRGRVHHSRYFMELTGAAFTLELPHLYAHVDGEPVTLQNKTVSCSIDRSCLRVIGKKR